MSTISRSRALTGVALNLVAFALIPSVLFTLLGRKIYMMHPLVNADYLALGIVAPWLPAAAVFVFYFALVANELLVNIAPIYHFSIGEFFMSFRYAKYLNFHVLLQGWFSTILLGALFTALAVWMGRFGKKMANAIALLVFAVVICSLDILNGTSFLGVKSGQSFADINFAYSGVRRSVMSLQSELGHRQAVFSQLDQDQAATSDVFKDFNQIAATKTENVVVVLVESYGKFNDAETRKMFLSHFQTPEVARHYQVKFADVPFHGSTIHGEFRELCNVRLEEMGDGLPGGCLPARFHDHGYDSLGFHGFSNQFYNRFQWYPQIGFNRTFFAEELKQEGIDRSCGASFTGVCDLDVLARIRKELLPTREGKSPRFIHWMTLNSHLPIAGTEAEGSHLDCSKSSVLAGNAGLCSYAKLVDQVLEGIAKLAQDPNILPTRFIMVGDHAPPFKTERVRDEFDQTVIPSIELIPRHTSSTASATKLSRNDF